MTAAAPLIQLKNITRRFGNMVAVKNISLDIHAGEFFTLLGPSGCGKTTLLRMIAGFDEPDEGEILLDGKNLVGTPPEQRPIHTVFQSYALFPHLNVAENIAFPLRMAKKDPEFIRDKVKHSLELVHLEDKGNRLPHELSGGQRQRVALARGLINQPRLLLLDEPLGALDAKLRENMQIELIQLQRHSGVTFIFVTHSQSEALALSHRIAVMSDGHVEQLDEPSKIYGFPANRFVADFIGNCNLLECDLTSIDNSNISLTIPNLGTVYAPSRDGLSKGKGWLALRPEQVSIVHADTAIDQANHFLGKVDDFLYIGDVTTYIVILDNGQKIEALLPNSSAGRAHFFEVGDRVQVAWQTNVGYYIPDAKNN